MRTRPTGFVPLPPVPGLYGIMGEFDNATDLLEAARRAHAAGYRAMGEFVDLGLFSSSPK